MGKYHEDKFCFAGKNNLYYSWIALVLLVLMIYIAAKNDIAYYFYRIISPLLMWYMFEFIGKLPKPKWWVKSTIFYYGMHIIVISPVAKIYRMLFGKSELLLIASHILVPMECILVLMALAYMIRKIFPNAWRIMVGGRI